jgi:hypothetical protein
VAVLLAYLRNNVRTMRFYFTFLGLPHTLIKYDSSLVVDRSRMQNLQDACFPLPPLRSGVQAIRFNTNGAYDSISQLVPKHTLLNVWLSWTMVISLVALVPIDLNRESTSSHFPVPAKQGKTTNNRLRMCLRMHAVVYIKRCKAHFDKINSTTAESQCQMSYWRYAFHNTCWLPSQNLNGTYFSPN